MRILLYNPDNGVTRNFMPHLWMFLLQALTPAGHEVVLIDGNAQLMDEAGIARFVREQNIGLVGIGAMTRMIAKAYRMADAIRAVGVPVVMGGPHVTEEADEALGRNGGPRHADQTAERTLMGYAAFHPFRHGLAAFGRVLEIAVAGARFHGAERTHAAIGLERAALVENGFSRRLFRA